MRALLTIILISLGLSVWGQIELSSRYETLPSDSLASRSVYSHTSMKPLIRIQNSLNQGNWKVEALSDLNYIQNTSPNYKLGTGAAIKANIWNRLFLDLNLVGGYYKADSVFTPNTFMRPQDSSSGFYGDIRSRLSFTPNKFFNFQIGLDHNFIGEGSRSLLLSDYGIANPFGLIRANFWRFEYSVLYQFLREDYNSRWKSKFNASHHISLNPTKWLNIGIFETVVFQPKDTLLNRGFDVEYLNPMIFYRPQEYSLGSSDNVLLGAELSLFYKSHCLYGQFILDEFYLTELKNKSGWWANKYGGQIGVKGNFEFEKHKFFYRLEYNFVRPYTYAHISSSLNYGNQNEAMAHPYHSNFMEILAELKWSFKKVGARLFSNYYLRGDDINNTSFGGDIYQSYVNRPYDFGHRIGQGIQKNGTVTSLMVYYKILNHGNIQLFLDNQLRFDTRSNRTQACVVVGLRSFLWNDYRNY